MFMVRYVGAVALSSVFVVEGWQRWVRGLLCMGSGVELSVRYGGAAALVSRFVM